MDRRGLIRLRIGFTCVGLLLLLPLFFLLRSAEARFEEQRRLRHEIVAERIFDEMERELTTLLAAERQRPSSAYDAQNTRVESWAPFVVGYFKASGAGIQLVANEQLPSEREARARAAVRAALGNEALTTNRLGGSEPTGVDEVEGDSEARKDAEEKVDVREQAEQAPSKAAASSGTSRRDKGTAERKALDKPQPRRARAAAKKSASGLDDELNAALAAPATAKQDEVLRQLNRGAEERQKKLKRRATPSAASRDNDDPLAGVEDL